MKKTNVSEFRSSLNEMLDYVQNGGEIELQKRNVSIAKVIPIKQQRPNQTKLNCGKDSVRVVGSLIEPLIPLKDWEMGEE